MNIAYVDPPYSGYFHRLAALLNQRTDGRTLALLSSPAYRMYARGDRSMVWTPGEPARSHALPKSFERAAWAGAGCPDFDRAFSHAVEWLCDRFREEGIDVCLLFSDARPFSAAVQVAAQRLGVVCLYFERGAYRYCTASLSTQGLNARFDLAAAQAHRQVHGIAAPPSRRRIEPLLKLRFFAFMLRNELACRLDKRRRPMQHKNYHFFNYLRIALRQWRGERVDLAEASSTRPAVLLPLQLQTDSQFVLHSPFHNNQELVDFVVRHVRAELPDAEVLVKKHPMDVRSYRLPEGSRLIDGNLLHYFHRALLVVCVNSTVGFEAASHGKSVICFGDSFYTAHPHILRSTPRDFARQLRSAVQRGDDPDAGRDLKAAVLRHYQAPGDVWAYDETDLDATVDIVMQHVHAARNTRPSCNGIRVFGEPDDHAVAQS